MTLLAAAHDNGIGLAIEGGSVTLASIIICIAFWRSRDRRKR